MGIETDDRVNFSRLVQFHKKDESRLLLFWRLKAGKTGEGILGDLTKAEIGEALGSDAMWLCRTSQMSQVFINLHDCACSKGQKERWPDFIQERI